MSYILEALKKVEQERAIGQVPGIDSGYERSNRTGFSRWLWVVIGVLVVNALLLAIALWPQQDARTVTKQVEHLPDVSPLVTPGPSVPAPRRSAPVIASVKPAVPVKPVTKSRNESPVALRPLPPLPEPPPAPDVEVSVTRATVTGSPAAPQSAVGTVPRNNNLPVWPQVSSQLFQQINSSLRLDVHVYSKLPEERFVLINMQKYHEGGQLQEGPVVDEITPGDVILSYRGQRFRVQ
jgi:general secretion pathway protein B